MSNMTKRSQTDIIQTRYDKITLNIKLIKEI